jgi:uncharacterized protein YecT (DUF1311 family)
MYAFGVGNVRRRLIMIALLVAVGTGLVGTTMLHAGRSVEPRSPQQAAVTKTLPDRSGEQPDRPLAVTNGDVVLPTARPGEPESSRIGEEGADSEGGTEGRRPAPGFNCAYAASWSELAICSSFSLAALDVRLNEVFSLVREHLEPDAFQRVRAEQVEWLSERETCSVLRSEDAQVCLARVIQTRVDDLGRYLESPR